MYPRIPCHNLAASGLFEMFFGVSQSKKVHMDQIVEQLKAIVGILHSMDGSGFPRELMTAIAGGLVAAIAALLATKLSAWFSRRDIERFTVVALRAEIGQIRERLNLFLSRDGAQNFTSAPFLNSPERSCPAYLASGAHVGALNLRAVASVVKFYGSLLTLRPRVIEPPIPDIYLSDDLRKVVANADECLGVLKEQYPD